MQKKTPYTAEERALYQRLASIALNDAETLVIKGRSYGDSWKRRGGVGAFMMLARKWDRIENLVKTDGYDVFTTADANRGDILDDIRDLRRYLMLVEDHVLRDPWTEMAPAPLPENFETKDADELLQTMAEHAASLRDGAD
jgi:hypothetical protein